MSCDPPSCPAIPGYTITSQSWTPEEGWWCVFQSVTDPEDIIDRYCGQMERCATS